MEEFIASLRADAVEQCNAANVAKGLPANDVLNGYVNQFHIKQLSDQNGDRSYTELLRQRGDPGVGTATVFVSWFLAMPLATLIDALREFLRQHPEKPPDTKFWVCDYVIRQSTCALSEDDNDVKKLGLCVRTIHHTVLLMEPWDNPMPLKRAYCIKEVYHTHASNARFELAMSKAQQESLETELLYGGSPSERIRSGVDSIATNLTKVDVRMAECRNPKDKEEILEELNRVVGLAECNELVSSLLREELASRGRAAFDRLQDKEKGRQWRLQEGLGKLLQDLGKLDEAEWFLRNAADVLHYESHDWLPTMSSFGKLLHAKGDLEGAEQMFRRHLTMHRETVGDSRPECFISCMSNLAVVLRDQGKLDEAENLFRETLEYSRNQVEFESSMESRYGIASYGNNLHDRHVDHFTSMYNLGSLFRAQGKLDDAEPLYREALAGQRETLGARHPHTLGLMYNLGLLLQDQGKLDDAEPLCREALAGQRETLGGRHRHTIGSIDNLGSLLKAQGRLDEAETFFREALDARDPLARWNDKLQKGAPSGVADGAGGGGGDDDAPPLGSVCLPAVGYIFPGPEHMPMIEQVLKLTAEEIDSFSPLQATQLRVAIPQLREMLASGKLAPLGIHLTLADLPPPPPPPAAEADAPIKSEE